MTEETTGSAHVHVVRGVPDDVELAALVAGLAAVQATEHGGEPAGAEAPRSAWGDRARAVRGPGRATAGPDAWRWSLRG